MRKREISYAVWTEYAPGRDAEQHCEFVGGRVMVYALRSTEILRRMEAHPLRETNAIRRVCRISMRVEPR